MAKGSGGQLGGSGGVFGRAVWLFICACIIVALYRGLGGSPQAVWSNMVGYSKTIDATFKAHDNPLDAVKDLLTGKGKDPKVDAGGSTGGVPPVSVDVEALKRDVSALKVGQVPSIKYDRGEWNHWVDVRPCWSVREEVLYRDAVKGSQKLVDGSGRPVSDVSKACGIVGGSWVDRYTGKTFTDPKAMDIDHMVPLRNAAISGGQLWPERLRNASPVLPSKELYANYLVNPVHLVAVSATANRAKGDKGPEAWMPPNKAYHKQYVASWVSVKKMFNLAVNPAEAKKIGEVLAQ